MSKTKFEIGDFFKYVHVGYSNLANGCVIGEDLCYGTIRGDSEETFVGIPDDAIPLHSCDHDKMPRKVEIALSAVSASAQHVNKYKKLHRVYSRARPTLEFAHRFGLTASISIDCGYCGRTYYDGTSGSFDEGELELLQQKQKDDPEKYIEDSGSIDWIVIGGKQAVVECPCGAVAYFESLMWNHRDGIVEYLAEKCAEEKDDTDRSLKIALAAKEAVEESLEGKDDS